MSLIEQNYEALANTARRYGLTQLTAADVAFEHKSWAEGAPITSAESLFLEPFFRDFPTIFGERQQAITPPEGE